MTGAGAITAATLFAVSGGARGITGQCVVAMARAFGCRFVLLGRSARVAEPAWAQGCEDQAELMRRIASELTEHGGKPSPMAIQHEFSAISAAREIERTLDGVAAAGGRAEYIAADVADAAGLARSLADAQSNMGRVSGLIHGAGALSDKPIERKTAQDFELVYASKVRGLQNLLRCLPPEQLEHLLLFSSAAGFFGNPGQADYALSNEILNRAAHMVKRLNPGCNVVVFNWGPWQAGMVTPQLGRMFATRGIELISVGDGTAVLLRALQDAGTPVQLLVGDGLGGGMSGAPSHGKQRTSRKLSRLANPFLDDHRVGQHTVLPAVCAMSWMANAGEQLCPGYRFARLESFQVLKGIVFDETLAASYSLELTGVAAHGDPTFEALIQSHLPNGSVRYHYRGVLTLTDGVAEMVTIERSDFVEDARAADGAELYADRTLFHGRVFQGIERLLNASQERLTARCCLPALTEAAQGQFPVQTFNPFTADLHYQALVVWCRLFHDVAGLPLSASRVVQYRPLPFQTPFFVTVSLRSASEYEVLADTVAHDADGLVYSELRGASLTLSQALNDKFVAPLMA